MPTTSRRNVAATGDALNGLKFKVMPPSLVTVAAASQAAGGVFSYSVGSERQLCVDAAVNIEISADGVDMSRDVILSREPAPAGEHFLDVSALGTAFNFVRIVETA
jgi:hypothetical protein